MGGYEIPRHWRLKKQRYGLVGVVCSNCDAKLFPPRDICPRCKGEAKEQFVFSGNGEVFQSNKTEPAKKNVAA